MPFLEPDNPVYPLPQTSQWLAETLRYVVHNVPFYKKLFDSKKPTLDEFPFMDPARGAFKIEEFLVLDRFPDFLLPSGGTSGRMSQLTFRNLEEYENRFCYLYDMRPGQYFHPSVIREFGISIAAGGNLHYQPPHGYPVLYTPLENLGHAEAIRYLLEHGFQFDGRRIPLTTISCSVTWIKLLTAYFQATGFNPPSVHLEIGGWHLTRVWKELLKEFWKGEVDLVYGVTEFNYANASSCEHCGFLHFPETVYVEFVSFDGRHSVEQGDAMLVLTSLYPFVTVHPRIRYWTGDVVEVRGVCTKARAMSFVFLGRREHILFVKSDGDLYRVISAVNVAEVLDMFKEICDDDRLFILFQQEHALGPIAADRGSKLFAISSRQGENGETQFVISVEVKRDNQELRKRILDSLHSECPRLEDDCRRFGISMEVNLLPKGGLRALGIPYIHV